jgi:hypothetical protein
MDVTLANIADFIEFFKRFWMLSDGVVVPGAGIEPATRGFSVRCSTN